LSVVPLSRTALIGPARTFPIPFPKQNRLNIACEGEGSLLIAVNTLAHIAVYSAPKKPYNNAKKMRGNNSGAKLHMLSVAIAATDDRTTISALINNCLSER
jgi:hypothetical protein